MSVPVRTWMVAYDVSDARRRQRIAAVLKGVGQRVQYSVFECRLNETEFNKTRARLLEVVDLEVDRVRWYPLCGPCLRLVVRSGAESIPDDDGFVLV